MNSEVNVNILDNSMLPIMWEQFRICPFLYRHNDASVHTAKVIASWFEDKRVDGRNWPFQSPGQNPIKHLLDEVEG